MASTTVIITFQATTECAHDFAALMSRVKQDLPGVPGCRGARLFVASDGLTFTLMEEWDSISAHRDHIAQVVASGAWGRIAAQLAVEPVSRYYTER